MVFMLIPRETLFTTPLNHQRFWWFSLIFAADLHENLWNLDGFHANPQGNFIYYPPWIIKDFDDFHWFLLLICMKTFEILMVFMLIPRETLFTTPLNHQRFWWFSLIFAADLHENLWNLDGFHANPQGNFIYYPPESSKILMIFIDFCCWFAWQPLKSWWFSC